MSQVDPSKTQPLTPAELRAMADAEQGGTATTAANSVTKAVQPSTGPWVESSSAPADPWPTSSSVQPQSVESLPPGAVFISPADLKELLSLKEQLATLRQELTDAKKLPQGIGDTLCQCAACHIDNIIQPGTDGYKEVKDPETGALLPYMATGTHAA